MSGYVNRILDKINYTWEVRAPPDASVELINMYMLPHNVYFSPSVPCISCLCTVVYYGHTLEDMMTKNKDSGKPCSHQHHAGS